MRRIALRSLVHERGKLFAALAGVAFAGVLVWTQGGLYAGFLRASSRIVDRVGGDLWLAGRGARVVDNGEPLSSGVREVALAHPAVARVRPLVFAFAGARKAGGGLEFVQVLGVDRGPGPPLPWTIEEGLPDALEAPDRVAVDRGDLVKLDLPAAPLGATLEVGSRTLHVAAVTEGIRGFTLSPYLFTGIDTAREVLEVPGDAATYWVVDLHDPARASEVAAWLEEALPDVSAWPRQEFMRATEDYWVRGSGAGTALALSAILGAVVGVVIVGQTLHSLTAQHLRELATLKAIGATPGELVGFVAWQAGALAGAGGVLGLGLTLAGRELVSLAGLEVALTPGVLGVGAGAIVSICLLASAWSVRTVLGLEAARVFR